MDILTNYRHRATFSFCGALAAAVLLTLTVTPSASAAYFGVSVAVGGDANSVFGWNEIPVQQEVIVTRATFDEGGYQLYDTAGETIVVPFEQQNLYVMKFGVSYTGSMYFVNMGNTPVLYVPEGGYLVNATCTGARWYPFSHHYRPSGTVYIGIAPSWSAYVSMGWYPNMTYYGGYYCNQPYIVGGAVFAMAGLVIYIGDSPCNGWWSYYHYYRYHPSPYRMAYWNRSIYTYAGDPIGGGHIFMHQRFSHPFGRTASWQRQTFSGRVVTASRPMRSFRGGIAHTTAIGNIHSGRVAVAPHVNMNSARMAAHNANARRMAAAHNANARRMAAAHNANAHRMAAAHNANAHRMAAARNANAHRMAATRNASARRMAAARNASARRVTRNYGGTRRVATRSYSGERRVASHSYGGERRVASHSYGGERRVASHSYGGGSAERSFGGGGGRAWAHRTSFGGGGRSFSGGGGRSFSGPRGGGNRGGGGGNRGGGKRDNR